MAEVVPKRVTAKIEGDFVVFLIGMRINKPWKLQKWLPVFLGMPKMNLCPARNALGAPRMGVADANR
jgi:hypothetical protein